jgi:DNA-binding transcriptional LysR family regulator
MRQRDRRIQWDDLRVFLAVSRCGTLSAASQHLGVDDATVSRRMARLELAMNTKLFEHRSTGYVPTPGGERLRSMVEEVESKITACEGEISDENDELDGIIRIGAPDGFGSYFLGPRLAAFCNAHPKLEINLFATSRVFSLPQREADIFISLALPAEGRIMGRKLTDYNLGLYAAAKYVANHPRIRSVEELHQHPFVGYIEEVLFSPLLDYLPSISKSIKPKFRSSNLLALLQAVREGEGIAVLPKFVVAKTQGLVAIMPDKINIRRAFYLLSHEDNRNNARIRAASNYIFDEVQKNMTLFLSDAVE